MPDAKSWKLPPPLDHQAFDRLCLDILVALKKPVAEPNRFGRNGQSQHGVDFLLELADGIHGYQVKLLDKMSFELVEAELAKTSGLPFDLKEFVLLTTAPLDAAVQAEVIKLSQSRRSSGLCPASIVGWQTIQQWLGNHLDICKAHYPQIVPDLFDIVEGTASELARHHPGAHFTVTTRSGQPGIAIHGGPDGIQFSVKLFGEAVAERFEDAIRQGTPVTFAGDEFAFKWPAGLPGLSPSGDTGRSVITLTPSMLGRSSPVRVVVAPLKAHHNLEMFTRRGPRDPNALPATLQTLQDGLDVYVAEVNLDRLPIQFRLEERRVDGTSVGKASIVRVMRYVGASIEAAVEAERLFGRLNEGAYVGVFGGSRTSTWITSALPGPDNTLLAGLEALHRLAVAADWEINLPAHVTPGEELEAKRLFELFTAGRRVSRSGGSGNIVVRTVGELETVKGIVDMAAPSATMRFPPEEIEFFGAIRRLPARVVRCERIGFAAETKLALLAATEVPWSVPFDILDGAEVIEELVKEEG